MIKSRVEAFYEIKHFQYINNVTISLAQKPLSWGHEIDNFGGHSLAHHYTCTQFVWFMLSSREEDF